MTTIVKSSQNFLMCSKKAELHALPPRWYYFNSDFAWQMSHCTSLSGKLIFLTLSDNSQKSYPKIVSLNVQWNRTSDGILTIFTFLYDGDYWEKWQKDCRSCRIMNELPLGGGLQKLSTPCNPFSQERWLTDMSGPQYSPAPARHNLNISLQVASLFTLNQGNWNKWSKVKLVLLRSMTGPCWLVDKGWHVQSLFLQTKPGPHCGCILARGMLPQNCPAPVN